MSLRLFPAFFILSAGLFSCAPKDAKLVRPADTGKPTIQSVDETLKLSFIAFDKQIEALFLVKALLNDEYAQANGVEVKTVASKGSLVQKTILIKNQVKENDDYVQSGSLYLGAELEFNGTALVAAKIYNFTNQQDVSNIKSKKSKSEMAVNSVKKVISLKKLDSNFIVELNSMDELITAHPKSNEKYTDISKVSSSMTIVWDGNEASLGVATSISKLSLSHLKLAQAKSEISLSSVDGKLIVQLDGPCWQLNGELRAETANGDNKVETGKKSEQFTFLFENSAIKIAGKKIESPAAECASRSVVDLRKLQ